jgi:hypothetical protein
VSRPEIADPPVAVSNGVYTYACQWCQEEACFVIPEDGARLAEWVYKHVLKHVGKERMPVLLRARH